MLYRLRLCIHYPSLGSLFTSDLARRMALPAPHEDIDDDDSTGMSADGDRDREEKHRDRYRMLNLSLRARIGLGDQHPGLGTRFEVEG